MKRVVVVLVTLAALAAPATADPARELQALFEAQRRELKITGLAYAVIADDRVIAMAGLGLRDAARQRPVTVDTLFPIGSCTKAFTAMAVAIAHDERRLDLEDSPRRYLPWFRMQDPEANALVTIRDMLAHRTGLRGYADLAALGGVATRTQYLRAAIGAKPVAKLRAGYQYSNAMFTAAGEIVAKVYGTTWERVIARKIFGPLGMTASRASSANLAAAPDATLGYVGTTPAPVVAELHAMAPAGAIASSARDMAAWVRTLLGGGPQLVREATRRELWRAHTPIDGRLAYALGWATYTWNGLTVVEHTGGSTGLSAIVSFIPERGVGFVVLANASPTRLTSVGVIAPAVWAIVLGTPASTAPAAKAPPRTTAPTPPPDGTAAVPTVDALLARMAEAAGGARMAQHATLRARATTTYAHHGVTSRSTIVAAAPAARVRDETLFVGRTRIGRVRAWFDGARGGQQTTFGQDATLAGDALALAARAHARHPTLDLRARYASVTIERVARIADEDAFVLRLAPARGAPERLYVSARTGLVIRRDTDDTMTTYRDFRNIDGEVVAHTIIEDGPLGEVTTRLANVTFGPAPARTFAPLPALR